MQVRLVARTRLIVRVRFIVRFRIVVRATEQSGRGQGGEVIERHEHAF